MILRQAGAAHAFAQDAGGFNVGTTRVPVEHNTILDLRRASRHVAVPNVIGDGTRVTIEW